MGTIIISLGKSVWNKREASVTFVTSKVPQVSTLKPCHDFLLPPFLTAVDLGGQIHALIYANNTNQEFA